MALMGSTSFFFMWLVSTTPMTPVITSTAREKYSRKGLTPCQISSRVTSARMKPVISPARFFSGTPAVQIQPYFSMLLMSYSLLWPSQ